MIISGSTTLEFFDHTQYFNSNLDLYVDHWFRWAVANWLQNIGYKFVPSATLRTITLTDALKVKSDPTINYPTGILILDFLNSDCHTKIQLTTMNASPLELVLRFHSSEQRHFLTINELTITSRLRYEPHHTWQSILHFSLSYFWK